MIFINSREKTISEKKLSSIIDSFFILDEIKGSKEKFCEFYETFCVYLIAFIFKKKISPKEVNFLFKLFKFKKKYIRYNLSEQIISQFDLNKNNIGSFFDGFHQYYLSIKNEGTSSKRQSQESFYTPKKISDLIIQKTIDTKTSLVNLKTKTYFDPCCGTGVFISSILQNLSKKGANPKEVLKNITAYDIDETALKLAMIICQLECGEIFSKLKYLKNFKTKDFIFPPKKNYCEKTDKKFDFIVMNPPYGILSSTDSKKVKNKIDFLKAHKKYKDYLYKNIDLYRLFLINCSHCLKNKGTLGCIIPMSFLADISSAPVRKLFFNSEVSKIYEILYFPEKLNLFKDVMQGFVILISKNEHSDFTLISEMKDSVRAKYKNEIKFNNLKKISGSDFKVPLLDKKAYKMFLYLSKFPKIQDFDFIINRRGELDLTLNKEFLQGRELKLIKGASISKYEIKKYFSVDAKGFVEKYKNTEKKINIKHLRIVGQNISNSSSDIRLKFALIDKGVFVSNSANYLFIDNPQKNHPFDIFFLLGLLNSKLLNDYFKVFSSNNHINNYEIDQLPVPKKPAKHLVEKVSKLVKKMINTEFDSEKKQIDAEINILINKTFELS